MTIKEYQEKAHGTSLNTVVTENDFIYPVLGLGDEAGEVLGKVKKLFRDKGGVVDEAFKEDMKKELGDICWYLSEVCTKLGIDLETVFEKNIEKLYSRKERGTLQGSGDNR